MLGSGLADSLGAGVVGSGLADSLGAGVGSLPSGRLSLVPAGYVVVTPEGAAATWVVSAGAQVSAVSAFFSATVAESASPPRAVSPSTMEPESRKTDTLSPLFRFSFRLEFSVVGYGSSAVKLPFSSAWMYAQTPALLPSAPLSFGSSFAEMRPLFSLTASTEPFEPS